MFLPKQSLNRTSLKDSAILLGSKRQAINYFLVQLVGMLFATANFIFTFYKYFLIFSIVWWKKISTLILIVLCNNNNNKNSEPFLWAHITSTKKVFNKPKETGNLKKSLGWTKTIWRERDLHLWVYNRINALALYQLSYSVSSPMLAVL